MGFGKMLQQVWITLTTFFMALEKGSSAINNLATWADESTGTFVDEARTERAKKLAALNAELATAEATSQATIQAAAATTASKNQATAPAAP